MKSGHDGNLVLSIGRIILWSENCLGIHLFLFTLIECNLYVNFLIIYFEFTGVFKTSAKSESFTSFTQTKINSKPI